MGLVKKLVFVADFRQGFRMVKAPQHGIKPDDGCKFLGGSSHDFSESLFKGTLADEKFADQLLDADGSLALIDEADSFHDQLVGLDFLEL